MGDQRSDVAHDYSVSTQTVSGAAWRGRCNIPSRKIDITLVAHSRNKASSIMSKIASTMPESLYLEIFPRLDIWPTYFNCLTPTGFSIDLFFFSEGSDVKVFDNLLNEAICTDFALKAKTGTDELLVFTSVQLPEKFHRFEGKHYFWGLFIGQNDVFLPKLENDSHIEKNIPNPRLSLNSADRRSFEGRNISDNSPLTPNAQTDKRGRRLDDAWKHAKPLDELRQKSECRYCGFVSKHGGISRLKAHLAGGNPKILLPGCHKVPPEVKPLMANWHSEWVKNTKAAWVKDHQVTQTAQADKSGRQLDDVTQTPQTDKRGRKLDDSWKHAKPLDELKQKSECRYCGFVSVRGGISRLKAHLAGGNLRILLPGCHKVPAEVKHLMANWYNEWVKNSKAAWVKDNQAHSLLAGPDKPFKRGRPLDGAWEHAKQFDEKRRNFTKCKYCDFVSIGGGIARLKVHLGGGDPSMSLKGCPNVSSEVLSAKKRKGEKEITGEKSQEAEEASDAQGSRKRHIRQETLDEGKNTSARKRNVEEETTREKLQEAEGTSETQGIPKRRHIIQETLGEVANTNHKTNLQKLIEQKKAELQKVQTELRLLESDLALIP